MIARKAPRPLTHVEERRAAATVLVIGTGAAGLRAAIELAERGVQVLCVSKRRRDDAHTVLEVLQRYFDGGLPAVTAIPLQKLGFADLRIEIEGIGYLAG